MTFCTSFVKTFSSFSATRLDKLIMSQEQICCDETTGRHLASQPRNEWIKPFDIWELPLNSMDKRGIGYQSNEQSFPNPHYTIILLTMQRTIVFMYLGGDDISEPPCLDSTTNWHGQTWYECGPSSNGEGAVEYYLHGRSSDLVLSASKLNPLSTFSVENWDEWGVTVSFANSFNQQQQFLRSSLVLGMAFVTVVQEIVWWIFKVIILC